MILSRYITISMSIVASALLPVAGQEPATIASSINDSTSITIILPDGLNMRLVPAAVEITDVEETVNGEELPREQTGKAAGYRVQVFSDNNPRTSKNEARTKEKAILAEFPQYATYVSYNSPYWRLKVGDFKSVDEAEAVADELKRSFPSYAREIRVVRDRVNVFK